MQIQRINDLTLLILWQDITSFCYAKVIKANFYSTRTIDKQQNTDTRDAYFSSSGPKIDRQLALFNALPSRYATVFHLKIQIVNLSYPLSYKGKSCFSLLAVICPECRGVVSSLEFRASPWDRYAAAASAQLRWAAIQRSQKSEGRTARRQQLSGPGKS